MVLNLPPNIANKRDIVQTLREIESIQEALLQHKVAKEQVQQDRSIPAIGERLDNLLKVNDLKRDGESLKHLHEKLVRIREYAPRVRVSFASEPEAEVTEKVVGWFRKELGLPVLVNFGVQPSIAGGFILQTDTHRYDFSLREHILNSVDKFREVLHRAE